MRASGATARRRIRGGFAAASSLLTSACPGSALRPSCFRLSTGALRNPGGAVFRLFRFDPPGHPERRLPESKDLARSSARISRAVILTLALTGTRKRRKEKTSGASSLDPHLNPPPRQCGGGGQKEGAGSVGERGGDDGQRSNQQCELPRTSADNGGAPRGSLKKAARGYANARRGSREGITPSAATAERRGEC
jgi:hypothetical protein